MGASKASLGVLFLVVATELIGFGLIIPVLPQIALTFEADPTLLGILMAAYSFAQFIAAPLLGSLSDKYGRKPLLVISKLGTVLAYVLLAFSQSYTLFLIARLLDGFTGGNISVARAYVADVTSPENRSKGMAVIGIAFGTGFILGPALGGFLFREGSSHFVPALVAGSLSLIAAVLTIFLLKEPEKRAESKSAASHLVSGVSAVVAWPILSVCFIYLVYMTVFSGFESTFSLFTHRLFDLTVRENSWMFVYVGVLAFIIQGGIMRVTVRRLALFTGIGLFLASFAFRGMSGAHSVTELMVYLAVFSLGIGFMNSFLPSLLSVNVDAKNQGAVMGFYEGIGSLSRVIGPLIAFNTVIELPRSGYFGYAAVLMVLVVFIALNKPLHIKKEA
jgi:DHA1 family tetracycline resistance protein-like MFS transporter